MRDRDLVPFLQWALPRLGMRWPGFRKVRRQVGRRIGRRLEELRLGTLSAYRSHLETHPDEWRRLDGLCRVTISRFWRDRGVWEALVDWVLPGLAEAARSAGEQKVACWSAGCAGGEEAYSLALAWELSAAGRADGMELSVLGTDVDPAMVERAREGIYRASSLKELPAGWRERCFERTGEGFRIADRYRTAMEFVVHDLRTESPGGPFRLVMCRNLAFTYFEETVQREVLGMLRGKLARPGILVVGCHERLPGEGDPASGRPPGILRVV